MRAAIIENGKVVNVVEVGTLDALPGLVDGAMASIGDDWDGETFTSPPFDPPPVVVPQKVTRRQGLQALLLIGVTVPMIEAHIEASEMTDLQKGLALIEVRDSQDFERNRPLVVSIGTALGLDLDELFTTAASL